jgi:hypothetical protein
MAHASRVLKSPVIMVKTPMMRLIVVSVDRLRAKTADEAKKVSKAEV